MSLKGKKFWPRSSYDSKVNNITTEFFNHALAESTTYRRIAGLFDSNSFSLCARGISELVLNDGKMELIISPILTKEDVKAIKEAPQEKFEEILKKSILGELSIKNEFEKDHIFALKYLLKNDFLEIRIDIPKDEFGIPLDSETIIKKNVLAEKRGIFQDRDDNAVSFRGPIDANKDSWENGIFSITVDVSWDEGQLPHVQDDIKIFDRIWKSADTTKLPDAIKNEIIKDAPKKEEISLKDYDVPQWTKLPNGLTLWPNQIRAVNAWVNNDFEGIFSIATSGGKTLAAIVSANRLPKDILIVVLVPTKDLAEQWEKVIKDYDPNAETIICDSDYEWKDKLARKLNKFQEGNENISIQNRNYVLVTDSSAIGTPFLENFRYLNRNKLMVIGDEVHHYGSTESRKILDIRAKYRLGLSATHRRGWDEIGTNAIINYFGRALSEAGYTIAEGIAEGRLSKYSYYPFMTVLESDEFEKYYQLTEDINKLHPKDDGSTMQFEIEKVLEAKLNQRAHVVKNARNKSKTYKEIIKEKPILPYMIFGDDGKQLAKLEKAHVEIIKEINKNSNEILSDNYFEYSGETEKKARKIILEQCVQHKRPIFAMYCLDEGIDIPEFNGAILVSSARSKRQYIQRRGRILRQSKKEQIAQLFDIVVFPPKQEDEVRKRAALKIVETEYERVVELSSDATNKYTALEKFEHFRDKMGYH